jgi:hypothetical protein
MKRILLLLCLLFTTPAIAQQWYVDSLRAKLAVSPPDTNKVILLADLAFKLSTTNPDTMLLLAQQGIELAQKLHFKKGEAHCLLMMAIKFEKAGNFLKTRALITQALKISEDNNDRKGVLSALLALARVYRYQGDVIKSFCCTSKL